MSFATRSLRHLAVRVLVSPPATTLAESTAVLKKLQQFGAVTSFTKAPHLTQAPDADAGGDHAQAVDVVFASSHTAQAACHASPFTVKTAHNAIDPLVEDPYNVRNLQSRIQPQSKEMICRVHPAPQATPTGQNILSHGFSPSDKTRLLQSLLDSPPPSSIIAGLAVLPTTPDDIVATAHSIRPPPDLTAMYHAPPPTQPQETHRSPSVPSSMPNGRMENDQG